MAGEKVQWKGPGEWRSHADRVQPGLSPQQFADLDQYSEEPFRP